MTQEHQFDIAIIGAGPGGYVAAIKAAQYGKKVVLIEKDQLGGTCLNYGCIPTKTLISNAQILEKVKKAYLYGIDVGNISFDYGKMYARKEEVISSIRKSLGALLKSHGVTVMMGAAKFLSVGSLKVNSEEPCVIQAEKIIIASGSTTLDFKAFASDGESILNSTSILEMKKLPSSLVVVGGGYIGCEFASLFAELGVKVTILEALPSIIAAQGISLSSYLTKIFKKNGIEIKTSVIVKKIEKKNGGVSVELEDGSKIDAEKALVSIGRKIVTEGLDLAKAGISLNEKGMIEVNDKMETEVPGIYAIGDVTGKMMLAHVASHQGIVAANNACSKESYMHYHAVPAVIFTLPEIAMVGMTLEEAEKKNIPAKVGMFPFQALGKAQASLDTEGFAQIIVHSKTKEILGAQVVGHDASSLIGQMAVAIQNEITLDCLIETIHAHPTIAEAWLEAALIANDTPIHYPPKRKKGE